MTNEQLCVLAQQGDESAKDILVRKTAGFVHLMAAEFRNCSPIAA